MQRSVCGTTVMIPVFINYSADYFFSLFIVSSAGSWPGGPNPPESSRILQNPPEPAAPDFKGCKKTCDVVVEFHSQLAKHWLNQPEVSVFEAGMTNQPPEHSL